MAFVHYLDKNPIPYLVEEVTWTFLESTIVREGLREPISLSTLWLISSVLPIVGKDSYAVKYSRRKVGRRYSTCPTEMDQR